MNISDSFNNLGVTYGRAFRSIFGFEIKPKDATSIPNAWQSGNQRTKTQTDATRLFEAFLLSASFTG